MQPSKKRSHHMSLLIKEGLEQKIKVFSALNGHKYFRQADWDKWPSKPCKAATLYDYFEGGWHGILKVGEVPEHLWHPITLRQETLSNAELLNALEQVEAFIKSRPIVIKESDIADYNRAHPDAQVPSRKTFSARFGSMAKANEAYQNRIQLL